MARLDLENFPESEAAKRMLSYVTAHWYDKSYVGKWVYEVMGRELDSVTNIIEELPDQLFIETATWGLIYHEQKYGLPMQPYNRNYEERRKLILEKLSTQKSMTPYRMEQILKDQFDEEVQIHDCNEGYDYGHPCRFGVEFDHSRDNFWDVLDRLNQIKQSHTRYSVQINCDMGSSEMEAGCAVKLVKRMSTTEEPAVDPLIFVDWLTDHNGNILCDHRENIFIKGGAVV